MHACWLVFTFTVMHALCRYETTRAGNAVAALKASLKPLATVRRDMQWKNIDAALVVPGDIVLLAAGSSVPADCLVSACVLLCHRVLYD